MEEPTVTVVRRRRLEWFGYVERRDKTENIRAQVVEMKIDGKRPESLEDQGGRLATPHRETAAKGERGEECKKNTTKGALQS